MTAVPARYLETDFVPCLSSSSVISSIVKQELSSC